MASNIVDLDYLKKHIEANKIPKTKFAKLLGVDYTTLYRVFNNLRNPGTKFISGLLNSDLGIDQQKIFLTNSLPNGKASKEMF